MKTDGKNVYFMTEFCSAGQRPQNTCDPSENAEDEEGVQIGRKGFEGGSPHGNKSLCILINRESKCSAEGFRSGCWSPADRIRDDSPLVPFFDVDFYLKVKLSKEGVAAGHVRRTILRGPNI